jgi:hypothetical protein
MNSDKLENNSNTIGDYISMNLIDFYNIKLNDIFSSFFIKYFIKLTANFDSIKEYQKFLYNLQDDDPSLRKGLTFFEIYIDKKYDLTYDDLNTAVNIYIKESLVKLLNKKINYKREKEILTKLFYKCFKSAAQYLYEHPNDIHNNVEYQKIIKNSIRYDIYNIIPFKYTIENYQDDGSSDSGSNKKIQKGGEAVGTEHNPFHESDDTTDITDNEEDNDVKEVELKEEDNNVKEVELKEDDNNVKDEIND